MPCSECSNERPASVICKTPIIPEHQTRAENIDLADRRETLQLFSLTHARGKTPNLEHDLGKSCSAAGTIGQEVQDIQP